MARAHLLSLLPLLFAAACGGAPAAEPVTPKPEGTTTAPEAGSSPVEVTVEAKSESKLKGTATFTSVEGGVKVSLKVSGAPPGKIGTHVHETGDCSSPDGKSAGGHFNPAGHAHGLPDGERHLGDLGNIEIAADGTGSHEIVVKGANLKAGDPNSYLGRAIIVHDKQDDGGQPTGNAGGRIGCGVIGVKK